MMVRFIAAAFAATLATSAFAQDIAEQVAAIPSSPTGQQLSQLAAENPNAYIYFVQDFLADRELYSGRLNGQLTKATVRSLMQFCRSAGIYDTCGKGPLLPQTIAVTAEAIAKELAPADVAEVPAPEEPVAAAEPATPDVKVAEPAEAEVAAPPVEPLVPAVLPAGWSLTPDDPDGTLGIKGELVAAGPAEATVRLSGTATRDGYFNIQLGDQVDATPVRWTTSVDASIEAADGTAEPGVRLWTSVVDSKVYRHELFDGPKIDVGTPVERYSATGNAPDYARKLRPYIQLYVKAGEVIDATVHIANPTLTPS